MDFDKDNFEEDNELAPLEEEEAGDVDEVVETEIDVSAGDEDSEEEAPALKRGSRSTALSGGTASSGRAAKKAPAKKAASAPAKKKSAAKAKRSAKKSSGKKAAKKKAKKPARKKALRGGKKKKR